MLSEFSVTFEPKSWRRRFIYVLIKIIIIIIIVSNAISFYSSEEWSQLSEAQRSALGLTFDEDGEFWMSFQDFVANFDAAMVCHLGPDTFQGDVIEGSFANVTGIKL